MSWLAIVAVLALALALRAWGLGAQALTMDETTEASIARCSSLEILTFPDGFPPLYQLILSAWVRVTPDPVSGRWISAIAAVATIYAVARWAEGVAGGATGLVAAGLLAISPLHVFLSQELRVYSLYLCFVAWSMMYFFAALRSNAVRDWAGFVIALTLGAYTHYYVAGAGLVMGVAFVGRVRSWAEFKRGAAAFVAVGLLCLPLAVVLLPTDVAHQHNYRGQPSFIEALGHTALTLFVGYSQGPSLREMHTMSLAEVLRSTAPWFVLIAVSAGWLLYQGWLELKSQPLGRVVAFIAVASAPMIGALGTAAGVGFKVRYWSWILFPLLVWLAAGVVRGWRGPTKWITAGAAAMLVAMQLGAVANRAHNPRYANEDVAAAARQIAKLSTPDVPVFAVADYMAPTTRFYLNGVASLKDPRYSAPTRAEGERTAPRSESWRVYPLTSADVRSSLPFDDPAIEAWLSDVSLAAGSAGEFWLVYSREFHGDPGGLLLDRLLKRRLIEPAGEFPGARLYHGKVSPDPRSP